jgi:ATP-dependent DNA helicase PIF1
MNVKWAEILTNCNSNNRAKEEKEEKSLLKEIPCTKSLVKEIPCTKSLVKEERFEWIHRTEEERMQDDNEDLAKFHARQQDAWKRVVIAKQSLFLTGGGGCGKSFLIRKILGEYARNGKTAVVLAPTGIAAENIGGETIHSFFAIPTSDLESRDRIPYLLNKIRQKGKTYLHKIRDVDLFIIDEISMVSDLLFDVMDQIVRIAHGNTIKPFGGKAQVLACGDFFQLPPAGVDQENSKEGFAFESKAWKVLFPWYNCLELEHTFRQNDSIFIDLLNRVRNGTLNESDHAILAGRIGGTETQNETNETSVGDESLLQMKEKFRIRLYSCNEPVRRHNQLLQNQLERNRAPCFRFSLQFELKPWTVSQLNAREQNKKWVQRTFRSRGAHATKNIQVQRIQQESQQIRLTQATAKEMLIRKLKNVLDDPNVIVTKFFVGQRVVLTFNLSVKLKLVHGSCGWIVGFTEKGPKVAFDGHQNEWVEIVPHSLRQVCQEGILKVRYIPLKPAWALTIHKSQGMTLNRASLSLKNIFSAGQAYVALSRVRNLEGLELVDWDPKSVFANPKVKEFYDSWKFAAKGSKAAGAKQKEENEFVDDTVTPSCFDGFQFVKISEEKIVEETKEVSVKEVRQEVKDVKESQEVREPPSKRQKTEKEKAESQSVPLIIPKPKPLDVKEVKQANKPIFDTKPISDSLIEQRLNAQLLATFGPQWFQFWQQRAQQLNELPVPLPNTEFHESEI